VTGEAATHPSPRLDLRLSGSDLARTGPERLDVGVAMLKGRKEPCSRIEFEEVVGVLGQRRPLDLPAESPALDPTRELFAAQTFRLRNHAPSTGLGRFDVQYAPKKGEVVARLNLEIFFDVPRDTPWLERPWSWEDVDSWTDAEKQQYVADMKATIEQGWNATPAPIQCTKPGWEQFVAMPRIEVNVFAAGEGKVSPHYQITVCKGGQKNPGDGHRPGVEPPMFGRPGQMNMDEDQLHDQDVGDAAQVAEMERLKSVLKAVSFTEVGDRWEISPEGEAALDAFANVSADTLPSMYHPLICADGWECTTPADVTGNKLCHQLLLEHLASKGAKHEIRGGRGGDEQPGVIRLELFNKDR
jgi:hypothetical protein